MEFSLALMSLMEKVKQCAPSEVPNANVLLRDQFVEQVLNRALHRELKEYSMCVNSPYLVFLMFELGL